ncbi:Amidase [Sphingobium chlorophenolicum L-1]|uniref:Amidase n=1 Tax=Sphingobium chlorophenolicum L-1 TaxID=690566 RepID=F6ETN7_SPHCR|nr:amidase [Sphingobium chlorophenolicum]AEG49532.1 Amidase [Sphingobium chlorophenolicum L-1]
MTDDLAYMTGHAALKAFRSGDLNPIALMDATLARLSATEPQINAWTETWPENARRAAEAAAQRYAKGDARPLEGLPLAVKEEMRLAGTHRASGSLVFRDRVDDGTDVYIQRLIDAGAIPIGKTTVPEFTILAATHSRINGISRNPWNLERSPGGSSGGSGAALAAGATVLATGTDIGGSIRIPAACCGVTGFKPSYGRNPEIPPFNLDYYSHTGPMARSVADLALMQNVTSGQWEEDIASLRERIILSTDAPADLRGWRIGWSADFGVYEVEADVRSNMMRALEVFAGLGASVEEVDFRLPREAPRVMQDYLEHLAGAGVATALPNHRAEMTDYAIAFAEASLRSTPLMFYNANQMAAELYERFGPMMAKLDVLVCPTIGISAPPAEYSYVNDRLVFDGSERRMLQQEWCSTLLFNMFSRCPVLSVPSGHDRLGVPTGIQIVGRAYHDESPIAAGLAFEAAQPWLDRPENRPLQRL